jgi:hypothetical protein
MKHAYALGCEASITSIRPRPERLHNFRETELPVTINFSQLCIRS